MICDEIYGSQNFIADITVINNLKGRSDGKYIATAHESLLIYHKGNFITNGVAVPEEYDKEYKLIDENGRYRLQGLRKRGDSSRREDRPNMYYPFYYNEVDNKLYLEHHSNCIEIYPHLSDESDGRWRWGIETSKERISELVAQKVKGRNEYDIFQKDYITETKKIKPKRNPDKDYWTEAVVFTTSNNSFGPTEISYLENKFCNLAIEANRYIVKNGNDPSPGHITEEKESELEEFVDYANLIMGTLGHKIFVPLNKGVTVADNTVDTASEEIELFFTRTIKKINFIVEASAKQTAEGFVVLKGSKIAPNSGADYTISSGNRKKREECKIENNILKEDVLFNSPSSAAEFVTGKSCNGWVSWKTKDGKTLHDLEKADSI